MTAKNRIPIVKKLFRLSPIVWLLFGVVLLFLSLYFATRESQPPKLEVGQVIDQFGTFRFPAGHNRLEIEKTASGNVEVSIYRRETGFHFFPSMKKQGPLTFEAKRDWFVCVDSFQRLWVFRGRWKKEWGKMPLGDAVPASQAVLMFGMNTLSNGGIEIAAYIVSSSGNWSGVPHAFFDRIPDKDQGTAVWGEIPKIPDAPLPLTQQQKKMLTDTLQNFR